MTHLRLTWDWRWERQRRELVGDCEAFLLGHLAERLEDRGAGVPSWAWTNLLAHAEEAELREECTAETQRRRPVYRNWRRARAYLAAEVLALVDAHSPLRVLQERVLRPVELTLAISPETALWRPSQWAAHVSSTLAAHRALMRGAAHHGRGADGQ